MSEIVLIQLKLVCCGSLLAPTKNREFIMFNDNLALNWKTIEIGNMLDILAGATCKWVLEARSKE